MNEENENQRSEKGTRPVTRPMDWAGGTTAKGHIRIYN